MLTSVEIKKILLLKKIISELRDHVLLMGKSMSITMDERDLALNAEWADECEAARELIDALTKLEESI